MAGPSDAALLTLYELTRKRNGRIATGADKAYDTRDFVSTVRELAKVDWLFVFSCAAFNLIRIPKLRAQRA